MDINNEEKEMKNILEHTDTYSCYKQHYVLLISKLCINILIT